MMIADSIKMEIESNLECKIINMRKIGSGVNNSVFHLQADSGEFALKIKERGINDFFDGEAAALRTLNGFIAPRLFLYGNKTTDSKFMVIEYIDGNPIKSVEEIGIDELLSLVVNVHNKTRRKTDAVKFFQKDVHDYLVDKCYSSVLDLKKIGFSKPEKLQFYCDTAIKAAAGLDYSEPDIEVLIHGDLNVTNIIKSTQSGWRLIDWELSRYSQVETEIAALIWAHCKNEGEISSQLKSDICHDNFNAIALLTLVRGLDVSTWRTKWINSLDKNDSNIDFYFEELAIDWKKIEYLMKCILI